MLKAQTINTIQMILAILLLLPAMGAWAKVWASRRPRGHRGVALALFLTDLFVAAAACVRLWEIHGAGAGAHGADLIVWTFGAGIAFVQFALSRGWFLRPGEESDTLGNAD